MFDFASDDSESTAMWESESVTNQNEPVGWLRAARKACMQANYHRAIELLDRAIARAPEWPAPHYEAATAHVMLGDLEEARRALLQADGLFSRGYFATKSRLDAVERELDGRVPQGTTRRLLELEWVRRHDEREDYLRSLLAEAPDLPQAWLELSKLACEPADRLAHLERGLVCRPDQETWGHLHIERALTLREMKQVEEAIEGLQNILAQPHLTVCTEEQAHLLLHAWAHSQAPLQPAPAMRESAVRSSF